ncbi:uncharacterized protein LOC144884823 [Branchiostoma floridae x Branchiostoma japonicum]
MADEDTTEKPSDSAADDTKDPPVQPVQEEEVGEPKGRRADSIQVDTVDGPEESVGVSGGKSSGCCGGCPVLTVIVLGILVGNAFGLLLIYQRFYAVKGSPVKTSQIKASLPPSVAPPANQRRRSVLEGLTKEVDKPKMTPSPLREEDDRPHRIRKMPMKNDTEIQLTPFSEANRKNIETVGDTKRLPFKIKRKTSLKGSKFQFRKKNALQ